MINEEIEDFNTMTEFKTIAGHKVPIKLFDEYCRAQMMSEAYLLGKLPTPSNTEYEKSMRWLLCSRKVMEIHKEICKTIGIEYSIEDDFYKEFHKEVRKATTPKG